MRWFCSSVGGGSVAINITHQNGDPFRALCTVYRRWLLYLCYVDLCRERKIFVFFCFFEKSPEFCLFNIPSETLWIRLNTWLRKTERLPFDTIPSHFHPIPVITSSKVQPILSHGKYIFQKSGRIPQNLRRQKGDKKQVPYWGHKNIRRNSIRSSRHGDLVACPV
jgi:hypothetical protein